MIRSVGRILAMGVGLACPLSACPQPLPQAPPQEQAPMSQTTPSRLSASTVATEFPSGEPVHLEIQLSNQGSQPLVVNGRGLWNSRHAPAAYRELWLEVTGPTGPLEFQCKVRAGAASASDLVTLAVGQTRRWTLDLNRCYDLSAAGIYTVVAWYQDASGARTADGQAPLSAPLSADPVRFEVRP